MNTAVKKCWRDSAALIVLSKNGSLRRDNCNYDVLLQTRTDSASFRNSVVFPGGVTEVSDGSPAWQQLIKSFGYGESDFNAFHRAGTPISPIFENNPVQRHTQLRITAIRETFEELGLLLCSRSRKGDKSGVWADVASDVDVKHWQKRVSSNPEELLNLCKELDCYPDIWSLYYWSSWLTPSFMQKRFSSAFFVTALDRRPTGLKGNTEVAKVEWLSPKEILDKNNDSEVLLYPPQCYELNRFAHWSDIDEFARFARERSCIGNHLYYHATVLAKDGQLLVYPGDDLYPSDVDYNQSPRIKTNKTISELRDSSTRVHRFEIKDSKPQLVLKNYRPNDVNMGDAVIPVKFTLSK